MAKLIKCSRICKVTVTNFDTADSYGAGHTERILRKALAGQRDCVMIATESVPCRSTKASDKRQGTGANSSPGYVRAAREASLGRLGTDRIDLLHRA